MENVVYIMAPRDWFDYVATGATLLLSVIAVFIAERTARQQNKIALFEKRFTVLECLNNVLRFSDEIIPEAIKEESLGNVPGGAGGMAGSVPDVW